jgi:hypothetical protein
MPSDTGDLPLADLEEGNSNSSSDDTGTLDCSKPFKIGDVTYDERIELDSALKALLLPRSNFDYTLLLIWVLQIVVLFGVFPNIGKTENSAGFWDYGTQSALLLSSIAMAAQLVDQALNIRTAYELHSFLKTINPEMDAQVYVLAQGVVFLLFYLSTIRVMAVQTSTMDMVVNSAGLVVIFGIDDLLVAACKMTGYTNSEIKDKYDEINDSFPNEQKPSLVTMLTITIFFGTWWVAS